VLERGEVIGRERNWVYLHAIQRGVYGRKMEAPF
jgi:hypothetical protein